MLRTARARPLVTILIVGAATVAAAASVVTLLSPGAVADRAAEHGPVAWLASVLSGTDDTLAAIDGAHQEYNRAVWGDGGDQARERACELMGDATGGAEEDGYEPTEVLEIAAVEARICEPVDDGRADEISYPEGVALHDTLEALEVYLRSGRGQGRS